MAGVGKEGEWEASKKHIHYSSSPEAVTICTSCAGQSGTWKLLLQDIHHLTSRSRIKGNGQAKKLHNEAIIANMAALLGLR